MNKLVILIVATAASTSIARADKVFQVGKGGTWDCKQDPVVTINHGKGTYTLKGACSSVNLNGGDNTLTIESTGSLNVTGGHNKVTVDSVDSINLVGSDNKVSYKGAVHGDGPSVNKIGTNNTVEKIGGGGGGGGAAKPVASEAPSNAGAQDCAKKPTAVINDGVGNYRFVGPCTRIVVNGGDNTLAIESVKELVVNGSTNTVTVDAVDKINVPGAENKITYKKGVSGAKPRISSDGEDNKITQTK